MTDQVTYLLKKLAEHMRAQCDPARITAQDTFPQYKALGLCDKNSALSNIEKRRRADIGIEHFKNAASHLKMVDPQAVLERYDGGQFEAEKALLCVFHLANKGLAHITQDLKDHPEQGVLLEIASRGVPSLVVSYLYTPLGIPAPNYKITSRPRDGQD